MEHDFEWNMHEALVEVEEMNEEEMEDVITVEKKDIGLVIAQMKVLEINVLIVGEADIWLENVAKDEVQIQVDMFAQEVLHPVAHDHLEWGPLVDRQEERVAHLAEKRVDRLADHQARSDIRLLHEDHLPREVVHHLLQIVRLAMAIKELRDLRVRDHIRDKAIQLACLFWLYSFLFSSVYRRRANLFFYSLPNTMNLIGWTHFFWRT